MIIFSFIIYLFIFLSYFIIQILLICFFLFILNKQIKQIFVLEVFDNKKDKLVNKSFHLLLYHIFMNL